MTPRLHDLLRELTDAALEEATTRGALRRYCESPSDQTRDGFIGLDRAHSAAERRFHVAQEALREEASR